jgi:uncharacterized protein
MDCTVFVLPILIFAVAGLYSAVGHGGASGYIAVLTLLRQTDKQVATDALTLNVLVATISSVAYIRARKLSWRLTWPFVLASVPASFLGGTLQISTKLYGLLLATVLFWSAIRLIDFKDTVGENESAPDVQTRLKLVPALISGALIGLVSGIVGVGGGIFLSPLMLFMRWADAKQVSATSAVFIVVNSLAGLSGRAAAGTLNIYPEAPLLVSALAGAFIGSHLGATVLPRNALCKVLSIVLIIAALKLIVTSS